MQHSLRSRVHIFLLVLSWATFDIGTWVQRLGAFINSSSSCLARSTFGKQIYENLHGQLIQFLEAVPRTLQSQGVGSWCRADKRAWSTNGDHSEGGKTEIV
jgi:hypothetical protein